MEFGRLYFDYPSSIFSQRHRRFPLACMHVGSDLKDHVPRDPVGTEANLITWYCVALDNTNSTVLGTLDGYCLGFGCKY